jgi:hypothetical protein
MPLARLENFLKNLNGNTLYVDPNELDASDAIDNKGNSRLRPFKTIQRALLEAARFSYVAGQNNDLFDQTTILIAPGTHYIDNRPGYWVDSSLTIKDVNNNTRSIVEFNLSSNFNLNDPSNELYIFNSIDGGVIVPRGTSIVSTDLRKTKIRPRYVPDPNSELVSRSAIFRLTGACYIFGFTIFDGDPLGKVYNTNTTNTVVPSYSHHKLTAFEYADGKNLVTRNGNATGKTDLDMYYYKLSQAYGNQSNRPVIPGYNNFQKSVDENRIVGELGLGEISISDVISGDGGTGTNVITVTTQTPHGLAPFTPILISGVGQQQSSTTELEYNGNFLVAQVVNEYQFTYLLSDIPTESLNPSVSGAVVKVISDTVSSASPYVFNCSLKSVYGMCGLHADGSKATGFRSIVTAQFTGISLQKDDRAFVKYDDVSGTYKYQENYGVNEFLHQESTAIYRPEWESYHIKASNDSFIQCVSIFAIGYSKQFVGETGGDQSITNSNSNFGAIALYSKGFKKDSLAKDNHGFITHIIPPKDFSLSDNDIRFYTIDSSLTSSLAASTQYSRIYFKDYNDVLNPPSPKIRGFALGGKESDKLYFKQVQDEYSIQIYPNYKLDYNITSIDTDTNQLTLQSVSGIYTGSSAKIVSKNAILPDGIEAQKTYFVRPYGGNTIKIYENLVNAESDVSPVDVKNTVGLTTSNLYFVSKVSDKNSGDVGHPIQWDNTNKNWYIGVSSNTASTNFWSTLATVSSPTAYVKRKIDARSNEDRVYRVRFVVPKESQNASAPTSGFIIQKSSSALNSLYSQSNSTQLVDDNDNEVSLVRNTGIIIDAWYDSGTQTATVVTHEDHGLKVGDKISINNLKSDNEPDPVGLGTGTGFNGEFTVASVVNELEFTYTLTVDPGEITTGASTYQSWLTSRDCAQTSNYRVPPYTIYDSNRGDLPYFICKQINKSYQVYSIKEIQKYVQGSTDGVYHLIVNSYKNTPSVSPFNIDEYKLSQSVENLYPVQDLDNPLADPEPTVTAASRKYIGKVDVNNLERSTTKETIVEFFKDFNVGKKISQITKVGDVCTITTETNHGLGGVRKTTISSSGSGFTSGTYYDIPLCGGTGSNATANVTINPSGSVSEVSIANPGSGYSIGDVLSLRGIPGSTTAATIVITTVNGLIFNPADPDSVQILGCVNEGNNGVFVISSVTANTITYKNPNGVAENSSTGGAILSGLGYPVVTSPDGSVYDSVTNTTTITTPSTSPHSLVPGNKVIFSDGSNLVSGISTVTSVTGITTFTVKGDASSATSVYSVGLVPTLKDTNSSNENLNSRQYTIYTGYKGRTNQIVTTTNTNFLVATIEGLNKGEFIQIDDEIMLVTRVSGGEIYVKRALFGTRLSSHPNQSSIKRIKILPIELRRNTILRASGHTFEYTGFGPGNYSTGMPSNQSRILTGDETLISQALTAHGGLVVYTGMNSNGEFFIGRKKFDALTGQEVAFSSPTAGETTNTGDFDNLTVNKITVNNEIDASTAIEVVNKLTVQTDFNVVGVTTFSSTIESTNCSTGALVISGGVGIAKNLNVCGDETVSGSLTVSGDSIVSGDSTVTGDLTVGAGSSIIGNGTIPIGGIIMWSGTIANIPTGWNLCDGSSGTPDLRSKFIVGAASDAGIGVTFDANTGAVSGNYAPGNTGGEVAHQLTVAEMPSHNHSYNSPGAIPVRGDITQVTVASTSNTTGQTTGSQGGDDYHENRPPYYALAFIMRTA